jgi:hypothetical protein
MDTVDWDAFYDESYTGENLPMKPVANVSNGAGISDPSGMWQDEFDRTLNELKSAKMSERKTTENRSAAPSGGGLPDVSQMWEQSFRQR